jgi:hypothetical protein
MYGLALSEKDYKSAERVSQAEINRIVQSRPRVPPVMRSATENTHR